MIEQLLEAAPTRGEVDRAVLVTHGTLLAHGFICTGCKTEPVAGSLPSLLSADGGKVSMSILPPEWNERPDFFSFWYYHPLHGDSETFNLKAHTIGGNSQLTVHAASNIAGADLLSTELKLDPPAPSTPEAAAARIKEWQEKVSASIAIRLLLDRKAKSMERLGSALEEKSGDATEQAASSAANGGTKRPAPGAEAARPVDPAREDRREPRIPFGWGDDSPIFWTPDGGLIGPRHPIWGNVGGRYRPFGGGGAGIMPRFDPIGPGMGEPNPDHLPVPGIRPGDFPAFQGGATGGQGGSHDPSGMFIL
mmetsp:Transcript_6176/g.10765  ORF Transcript_6176/g.10765 Transcript_6176/m.10765 type:complete len:307 (-) Transcript_6176:86-1006(-)